MTIGPRNPLFVGIERVTGYPPRIVRTQCQMAIMVIEVVQIPILSHPNGRIDPKAESEAGLAPLRRNTDFSGVCSGPIRKNEIAVRALKGHISGLTSTSNSANW